MSEPDNATMISSCVVPEILSLPKEPIIRLSCVEFCYCCNDCVFCSIFDAFVFIIWASTKQNDTRGNVLYSVSEIVVINIKI